MLLTSRQWSLPVIISPSTIIGLLKGVAPPWKFRLHVLNGGGADLWNIINTQNWLTYTSDNLKYTFWNKSLRWDFQKNCFQIIESKGMSTFSKDINESYNIAFCKEVITYQRYFQDQVSYLGISGKTLSCFSFEIELKGWISLHLSPIHQP